MSGLDAFTAGTHGRLHDAVLDGAIVVGTVAATQLNRAIGALLGFVRGRLSPLPAAIGLVAAFGPAWASVPIVGLDTVLSLRRARRDGAARTVQAIVGAMLRPVVVEARS